MFIRILGLLMALACSGCSLIAAKKVMEFVKPAPVYNVTYQCPALIADRAKEEIRQAVMQELMMDRYFEDCDIDVDCYRP